MYTVLFVNALYSCKKIIALTFFGSICLGICFLRSGKTYNFSHIVLSVCITAYPMWGPVDPRCPGTSVRAMCPDLMRVNISSECAIGQAFKYDIL